MKDINSIDQISSILSESFPKAKVDTTLCTTNKICFAFKKDYSDIYTDGMITPNSIVNFSYALFMRRDNQKVTNIHMWCNDISKCKEILDPNTLCMLS